MQENERLPQYSLSYWKDSVKIPSFSKLEEDLNVDVAIIGGGITGITTAYLLLKEGLSVAVIDADPILKGTTSHTTAKVTAQHELIYDQLIQHIGEDKARLYYQANMDAIEFIRQTVKGDNIDCDFSDETAYIYTQSDQQLKKLHNEFNAYNRLGIKGKLLDHIPLGFKVNGALSMNNQAQFHPLKYLTHLVKKIVDMGAYIYENTTAVDMEKGVKPKVITREGYNITCSHLVMATHFPFHDKTGFYFSRMYASRSYVLAAKIENQYPGGMYISAEKPKRSLRYTNYQGEKLILIGGEGHKTGHGSNEIEHYKELEKFTEQNFGIKEIVYRWSAQDLTTLDNIPYIGAITEDQQNILVATGYRKWGMTSSTVAASLLRDQILEKTNEYAKVFTPSRFNIDPSLRNFISQNTHVAKRFIQGKFEVITKRPEELDINEGGVVSVNGQRCGAYKDEDGKIHIVDTTCKHMGCETEWNDSERTWDCPCHGSRYTINGDVVEGPTKKPLQKMSYNK